jgi:hypothetical protein
MLDYKYNINKDISPEKTVGYIGKIFDNEKEKGVSILDLGASNARVAKLYKKYIKTYHAFDISKDAISSGENFLEKECNFNWYIKDYDLSNYLKFSKKFKNVLLKKYDIIVFNRVFHRLYPIRLSDKWKKGKYNSRDLLLNSFKMCKKWYVFSTTNRYMKKFSLLEFFKLNNFKLVFEDDGNLENADHKDFAWSGIFKNNND